MKKIVLILTTLIINSCILKEDSLTTKIDAILNRASLQYVHLMKNLPEGAYPKTFNSKNNKLETSGSEWWCSGFFPGSLIYLDEALNDTKFQKEIDRILKDLKKEQYNTTTHDLGFMMFCSFGNANRLNPKSEYSEILMNSAKSLSSRYDDNVKAIRSWDSASWNKAGKDDLVVIIDNMMNLELLFWATKHSGDRTYYDIAMNHANTTLQNHFRADFSSFHEVIYDEKTGHVKAQITNQGASDNSSWARGQAWALYGYTIMFRETKEQKFLEQTVGIAEFIINHPNLPKDKIPYWDFNAPNIPDALRDSSSGAIIASALLELGTYVNPQQKTKYLTTAKTILESLTSEKYIAKEGSNGGFILKHGLGNMPNNTEIDSPLTYGDYYLIEAILRYKKQVQKV